MWTIYYFITHVPLHTLYTRIPKYHPHMSYIGGTEDTKIIPPSHPVGSVTVVQGNGHHKPSKQKSKKNKETPSGSANMDLRTVLSALLPDGKNQIDMDMLQTKVNEAKVEHEASQSGPTAERKPLHWRKLYDVVKKHASKYFYHLHHAQGDTRPEFVFSRDASGTLIKWDKDETYKQLRNHILVIGKQKRTLAEILLGKPEGDKQKRRSSKGKPKTSEEPISDEPSSSLSAKASLGKRKRVKKPALKQLRNDKINGRSNKVGNIIRELDPGNKLPLLDKRRFLDLEAKESTDERVRAEERQADEDQDAYEQDFIDDAPLADQEDHDDELGESFCWLLCITIWSAQVFCDCLHHHAAKHDE